MPTTLIWLLLNSIGGGGVQLLPNFNPKPIIITNITLEYDVGLKQCVFNRSSRLVLIRFLIIGQLLKISVVFVLVLSKRLSI